MFLLLWALLLFLLLWPIFVNYAFVAVAYFCCCRRCFSRFYAFLVADVSYWCCCRWIIFVSNVVVRVAVSNVVANSCKWCLCCFFSSCYYAFIFSDVSCWCRWFMWPILVNDAFVVVSLLVIMLLFLPMFLADVVDLCG